MRLLHKCGRVGGFGVVTVLAVLLALAGTAQAAFPGRDGDLVVATSSGLEIVDPSTGASSTICNDAVVCGHPAQPRFSPNGEAIAFIDSRTSRAVVIAPDGSCLWCLVGPPLTTRSASKPAFTASGQALSVTGKGLWRISLSGGGAGRLAKRPVIDAVWSSRGIAAFVRGGWVWVGRPAQGKLHRLARGSSPSFSPDGLSVALVRRGHVWIIPVKGGTQRQLARGTGPAWSPNGRQIAYIGSRGAVEIIGVHGGSRHRVGTVRGNSLDWQPLPRSATQACAPPKGSTVLASTGEAVVYETYSPGQVPLEPGFDVYGCLRALGIPRPLISQPSDHAPQSLLSVRQSALAGRFAALEVFSGNQYGSSQQDTLYDLGNGNSSDLWRVGYPIAHTGPSLDSLALDSSGFAAWRQTTPVDIAQCAQSGTPCITEQLYAHDDQGTRTIDSAPPGTGNSIGNVNLSGNSLTLSWTHDGSQRQLDLG